MLSGRLLPINRFLGTGVVSPANAQTEAGDCHAHYEFATLLSGACADTESS